MKFMGSKSRIANDILPIILENRLWGQTYVEPFVGGANIIDKVRGKRVGFDYDEYLIEMWQSLQMGVKFPSSKEITKDFYDLCRDIYNNKVVDETIDKSTIGWVGYMASFNGRGFPGGFSGKHTNKKNG